LLDFHIKYCHFLFCGFGLVKLIISCLLKVSYYSWLMCHFCTHYIWAWSCKSTKVLLPSNMLWLSWLVLNLINCWGNFGFDLLFSPNHLHKTFIIYLCPPLDWLFNLERPLVHVSNCWFKFYASRYCFGYIYFPFYLHLFFLYC
jgi:hypothetical protein